MCEDWGAAFERVRQMMAEAGVTDSDLIWHHYLGPDYSPPEWIRQLVEGEAGRFSTVQGLLEMKVADTGLTVRDLVYRTCLCGAPLVGFEASYQVTVPYNGCCPHFEALLWALDRVHQYEQDGGIHLFWEFIPVPDELLQQLVDTGFIRPVSPGYKLTKAGDQALEIANQLIRVTQPAA